MNLAYYEFKGQPLWPWGPSPWLNFLVLTPPGPEVSEISPHLPACLMGLLIATGEAIPLRGLEGVPGLPGAPQDEAGLTRKFAR